MGRHASRSHRDASTQSLQQGKRLPDGVTGDVGAYRWLREPGWAEGCIVEVGIQPTDMRMVPEITNEVLSYPAMVCIESLSAGYRPFQIE